MKYEELPSLQAFPKKQILSAEKFGKALTVNDGKDVICFTKSKYEEAAEIYRDVLGTHHMHIEVSDSPLDSAQEVIRRNIIPIFMNSATDPFLKNLMFGRVDVGQLLADHNYVRDPSHESMSLYPVGTTRHGLMNIFERISDKSSVTFLIRERSQKIKEVLGDDIISYADFRKALHSPLVTRIPIHALGPEGTNISQVATQYINTKNLQEKAIRIVHESGIEPLEYAQYAKDQKQEGSVPLHIECAVFYGMSQLYAERIREIVFGDHHYMLLDQMQLVVPQDFSSHTHIQTVTSHPSPRPLLASWEELGIEWIKASSNADAAMKVQQKEADVGIATESARIRSGLEQIFSFGSPMMLFTVATPLNKSELRSYL
jgi:hypothetical protein